MLQSSPFVTTQHTGKWTSSPVNDQGSLCSPFSSWPLGGSEVLPSPPGAWVPLTLVRSGHLLPSSAGLLDLLGASRMHLRIPACDPAQLQSQGLGSSFSCKTHGLSTPGFSNWGNKQTQNTQNIFVSAKFTLGRGRAAFGFTGSTAWGLKAQAL